MPGGAFSLSIIHEELDYDIRFSEKFHMGGGDSLVPGRRCHSRRRARAIHLGCFCAVPGAIEDHSSGEVACDEYHRYPEDITLLKELGVNAYRLSIAWPRIVPLADGKVNSKGVEHYIKVLDALRDAGIRPVVTLYHWDLPQYLEDQGGWANRDTALRYGDYVHALAEAFGDRVDTWTTLNEHGARHISDMAMASMRRVCVITARRCRRCIT